MKSVNPIRDKSLDFGIRIAKLTRYLLKRVTTAEYSICNQILKSGTSIGANVREAEHAESRDDFKHKLKISLKEANETDYWLKILYNSNYIDKTAYESLNNDCQEIISLLISIIKTINNSEEAS